MACPATATLVRSGDATTLVRSGDATTLVRSGVLAPAGNPRSRTDTLSRPVAPPRNPLYHRVVPRTPPAREPRADITDTPR